VLRFVWGQASLRMDAVAVRAGNAARASV